MRKDLYGGFPGARFISKEELEGIKDVITACSPYRFYGLNLQRRAEALESLCCDLFNRKYALALSSGTAALHTALFALGVSEGDEIVLPAYAWSADLMSILALGAVPVIAPIDETLGLDISTLEECLSEKTKAIIAVHMRGYPCDLKGILEIAQVHGIGVIEDGAQCIGGEISGLPVGALGDISVLSFQYHKLVTSGEGGVLLTNDSRLYERAHRFHDLGMFRRAENPDPEGIDSIGSFGLNYRISELQAAFLIPQLKKMPDVLQGLGESYQLAIKDLSTICQEFHLVERKVPKNMMGNHAFLCLFAKTKEYADSAFQRIRGLEIPVQSCSRLDGHYFEAWRNFMIREKRPFRLVYGDKSTKILNRSLYIELNSHRI